MRAVKRKTKNGYSFYIIDDVYINGKKTTKVLERLGTEKEILQNFPGVDPFEWAKSKVESKKDNTTIHNIELDPNKSSKDRVIKSASVIYIKALYNAMKIDKICDTLEEKHKLNFNLNNVVSTLVIQSIFEHFDMKKSAPYELNYICHDEFTKDELYQSLKILALENAKIQDEALIKSRKSFKLRNRVIHFEIMDIESDALVNNQGSYQMGLFLDGDGIPIFFKASNDETTPNTLSTILQKVAKDSYVIFDVDEDIEYKDIAVFNKQVQKKYLKKIDISEIEGKYPEMFEPSGFKVLHTNKTFNIKNLLEIYDDKEKLSNNKLYRKVFYKTIKEDLENYIVAFSLEYAASRSLKKAKNIQKALTAYRNLDSLQANPDVLKLLNIEQDNEDITAELNEEAIINLLKTKVFFVAKTNIDNIEEIINTISRRWNVEERISVMQVKLKNPPEFIDSEEILKANVLINMFGLAIFRYLEKLTNYKYPSSLTIKELANMNFMSLNKGYYIPCYKDNDFFKDLEEVFETKVDYQIISENRLLKQTKTKKFMKDL